MYWTINKNVKPVTNHKHKHRVLAYSMYVRANDANDMDVSCADFQQFRLSSFFILISICARSHLVICLFAQEQIDDFDMSFLCSRLQRRPPFILGWVRIDICLLSKRSLTTSMCRPSAAGCRALRPLSSAGAALAMCITRL